MKYISEKYKKMILGWLPDATAFIDNKNFDQLIIELDDLISYMGLDDSQKELNEFKNELLSIRDEILYQKNKYDNRILISDRQEQIILEQIPDAEEILNNNDLERLLDEIDTIICTKGFTEDQEELNGHGLMLQTLYDEIHYQNQKPVDLTR